MSVVGDIAQGLTSGVTGAWGKVLDTALSLIGRVIPDPAQRAAAQLQILQMQQAGEFKRLEADTSLMLAQADINKTEAASPSFFKSGARPFMLWICGFGFAHHFLIWPFWDWLAVLKHWPEPPKLDVSEIMALAVPLLGLGAYRTVEKLQGKA